MWAALAELFGQMFQMADVWNDLAARTTDETFRSLEVIMPRLKIGVVGCGAIAQVYH